MSKDFSQTESTKPTITSKIKEWLGIHFSLPTNLELTYTELRCADPACPCVQTVLKVKLESGENLSYKIGKPLIYIREWDIKNLLLLENQKEEQRPI